MAGHEEPISPNHKKIMPVHCGRLSKQILRYYYLWTIKNFCLSKNKVGEFLDSPKFSDEENRNVKWFWRLYPNGEFEEQCGFLSLYLFLCEPDVESAFVKCTLSLCNSRYKRIEACKMFVIEYSTDLLSWGYPKLARRNALINTQNGLLGDDVLVIACAINAVFVSVLNHVERPLYYKGHSLTFKDLFENEMFSDVVLKVDGREISAHAVILVSQSPFFSDMFEQGISDMNIINFKYETIHAMLHYVYTNEIPVLNVDKAIDLFAASYHYAFGRLNTHCVNYLSSNLTVDTAVEVLYLAHTHGAEDLEKHCLEFVRVHEKELRDTAAWKMVADEAPELLLDAFPQKTPNNEANLSVAEPKPTHR